MSDKADEERRTEAREGRLRNAEAMLYQFQRMVKLWRDGHSKADIARMLNLSIETVHRRFRALRLEDDRCRGQQQ